MYQYSFSNVTLALLVPQKGSTAKAPLAIRGFGTGEQLITCMRKAPIASTQFGAYGDMIASMHRNRAGDLVFPVLMNAPENAILQKYANDFQASASSGTGYVDTIDGTVVDTMGLDNVTLQNGIIMAIPAVVRGQNMSVVTWVITFETMNINRVPGIDLFR